MSPFVDNEAEQYLPERQREINSLAGIETSIPGPVGGDDDSEEEDVPEGETQDNKAAKDKGDVDSSSEDEDEGDSEELSDSEEEDAAASKKGPGAKTASAGTENKPVTAKTAKKI